MDETELADMEMRARAPQLYSVWPKDVLTLLAAYRQLLAENGRLRAGLAEIRYEQGKRPPLSHAR